MLEAAKKAAKEAAASVEPSQLFKTAERAAAFSAWDARARALLHTLFHTHARERERERERKGSSSFSPCTRARSRTLPQAEGVPTHDAAGEALPKTQIKKLRKEFEKQVKLHEKAAKPAAAV